MRIRARRRTLVVWSSSVAPASRSSDRGRTQRARPARIRWWLRTGALLTIIGAVRLARITRARRRDALVVAATVLTVLGIGLGSMATFAAGMLVWVIARPWHWDESASR